MYNWLSYGVIHDSIACYAHFHNAFFAFQFLCGSLGLILSIRKKLLPALLDKTEKQQPMTLLEKDFLEESGIEIDSGKINRIIDNIN